MRSFRNLRRSRRTDQGTTLIELLVSMSIFSLAMAVVFGAVILVMRKSADVQKSADAASELRIALAQIDRQVRSGNVLFSPADEQGYVSSCSGNASTNSGTCMRIFTQSNGSEKCVQWQITDDPSQPGTKLLRTRSWATSWQTSGDLTAWGTVARALTLTGGDPFTLQGASTPYKERLLDVRLEVYDARRKASVVIQSSMSGRNTTYGYTTAQCTPVPPA
jgi:prepilin-type N-terminal cleavage/methylation domain-containing protein